MTTKKTLIIILIFHITLTKILKITKKQNFIDMICSPKKTCKGDKKCCPNKTDFFCCPSETTQCCNTQCCSSKYPICDIEQNKCWKDDCTKRVDMKKLKKGVEICKYYKENDWLPPDYKAAAYCACSGDGSHR